MTFTTISQEQADEMIFDSAFGDLVEDYELNELGHVYTLTDGSAVVITESGKLRHITD